ncbi:ATP-binding protein [Maribellus sp. CM-23]|uniref:ATP-binding protein n=1 Tax=Maribellus sp. CM-23 TaxID=2781026 RepID=UPI001F3EA9D4|nr:ATP-binding protein [Maribellus sp. CM-23]MCE4564051.1 ATP-binding protein [Maribellus sp. CM-23]
MILRSLEHIIIDKVGKGKAIIVKGARQTGKTTLIKKIMESQSQNSLYLNADIAIVRQQLQDVTVSGLKQLFGNAKLIFIDEAQRIPDVGITLKIIVDEIPEVQLIVTGSSAFELANNINEPLTGRKFEYYLYPVSWIELSEHTNYIEALSQFNQRLVFGMYPDVINHPGAETEILFNLTESYLYKDIIAFQEIRKPEFVQKLLQALAFQVGSEVSYNEISSLLQIDRKTIIHYIDILEKAYVIFRLPSFSRNLRNELSSKIKIYFYDNGIRNALINDFKPLEMRGDKGALWENFIISERIKSNHYALKRVNSYFWRTHQKQEIDYIEEAQGKLEAFEFKWKVNSTFKIPKLFLDTYTVSNSEVVHPNNFYQFLRHE